MLVSINVILFGLGALLLVSVILSKFSSILGIPTLIVFLLLGLVIDFGPIMQPTIDNYTIVLNISIFALIIIMFTGGLETDFQEMKPIAKEGIALSTIGVFLTAFVTGFLFHLITGVNFYLSLLVGATISSTDVAAVFSIFKSNATNLKHGLDKILELESATNDPTAYVLTTSLIYFILHPASSVIEIIFMFFQSIIVGAVIGYLFGLFFTRIIKSIHLEVDGLYPVLLIGVAVFTYACSEFLGGNGFLAVYLSALIIGNRLSLHRKPQASFFEGLSWLMQVVMFIILGMFTLPNELFINAAASLLVALIIIFVARPVAVFLTLIPFKYDFKSKLFLSWAGIKGAVPIVFAFYPLVYSIPGAYMVFNTVFFVTIISMLLQGSTVYKIADKLGLVSE
ncbi:potassium/proton antiporter [Methanobrevibacter sp. DSM 116169]|uniref:potassium/proton antiporter n=1 Tax=Methanobrevibacter sp. DSM 116169 TaxID=3242727 RepID=UPI0038FC1E69